MFDFWNKHLKTLRKENGMNSVERIPPPGWTVYVLYSTDGSCLYPDLNWNRISLFLSPTHSSTKFCHILPKHFEISRFVVFWHHLSMENNCFNFFSKKYRNRNRIFTKNEWMCYCHTPKFLTKFGLNPSITFFFLYHAVYSFWHDLNGEESA